MDNCVMLGLIISLCATIVANTNSHKLLLQEKPSDSLGTSSDNKSTVNSSQEIQNNSEETTTIKSEEDSTHENGKNTAESVEKLQRPEDQVMLFEPAVHVPINVFNGDRCPIGFVKVLEQCVEEH